MVVITCIATWKAQDWNNVKIAVTIYKPFCYFRTSNNVHFIQMSGLMLKFVFVQRLNIYNLTLKVKVLMPSDIKFQNHWNILNVLFSQRLLYWLSPTSRFLSANTILKENLINYLQWVSWQFPFPKQTIDYYRIIIKFGYFHLNWIVT